MDFIMCFLKSNFCPYFVKHKTSNGKANVVNTSEFIHFYLLISRILFCVCSREFFCVLKLF